MGLRFPAEQFYLFKEVQACEGGYKEQHSESSLFNKYENHSIMQPMRNQYGFICELNPRFEKHEDQ